MKLTRYSPISCNTVDPNPKRTCAKTKTNTQKFPLSKFKKQTAMALCNSSPSFSLFGTPTLRQKTAVTFSPFVVCCSPKPSPSASEDDEIGQKRRLSEQSSWEAKDLEGRDYLYRLGKEADNMNVAVGARSGVIDDLFAGNFLGRDCNLLVQFTYFKCIWF